ncbi:MAG: zinc carboxypeptidase [Candidatus Omnitrophica bacterium]|nr:zinc carboxypeptidase [Candidatus Omnitrophota bacterium]
MKLFFFKICKAFVFIFLIVRSVSPNVLEVNDYFRVMGEVYFRFQTSEIFSLREVSKIVSIEKIKDGWVYAYANKEEFEKFLKTVADYEILHHPGYDANVDPAKKFSLNLTYANQYPSYNEYLEIMNWFQSQYPDICQIYEIGTSVLGRKILCAKITGLTDIFFKPRVFLTSTIHGNEPAGYVVMLQLIDYLLTEYGTNQDVTRIVNNCEIWINPLANPDGTYWAGDDTVFGARRYNANGVDLNRNFPDPEEGLHPDGRLWQPETIAMMDFATITMPVLSANYHSGAEVVNYPWDTWERLHPDNDWFVSISRNYADTVHLNSPPGYFDDFDNGITNGYAWYPIAGGRQDYMNYFQHCREVTIEISHENFPREPFLYWTYNSQAIINFISQSQTGICGIVSCQSNGPIKAKVEIPERDYDNSFVFSEVQTGRFFRLLLPGKYNLKFSAPYHYEQKIENVEVIEGELTTLHINLEHASKGDPSADRIIDISDVILCLRMAIGLEMTDLLSCDINDDGAIDISDVILILRMSIGL